ncbi:MAG: hypothetical protein WCS30_02515 [Selenomonadaceae bacterium]
MKKWSMLLAGILTILMCSTAFAAVTEDMDKAEVTVTGYSAYADHLKQSTDVTKATNAVNQYIGKNISRDEAMQDAYKQLETYIRAIQVAPDKTVTDRMAEDPVVNKEVMALIKDAEIIRDQAGPDGYNFDLKAKIYGINDSVGRAVLPHIYNTAVLPTPTQEISVDKSYTGLVVDCTGLGLKRIMMPSIKDTTGRAIYFYQAMQWDKVVRYGMAAYTINGVMPERVGATPLVIKATGLTDGDTTVVVSNTDADLILAANLDANFFFQCAVAFEY